MSSTKPAQVIPDEVKELARAILDGRLHEWHTFMGEDGTIEFSAVSEDRIYQIELQSFDRSHPADEVDTESVVDPKTLRKDIPRRREFVATMRERKLSLEAIAAMIGVSAQTVSNDLQVIGLGTRLSR